VTKIHFADVGKVHLRLPAIYSSVGPYAHLCQSNRDNDRQRFIPGSMERMPQAARSTVYCPLALLLIKFFGQSSLYQQDLPTD